MLDIVPVESGDAHVSGVPGNIAIAAIKPIKVAALQECTELDCLGALESLIDKFLQLLPDVVGAAERRRIEMQSSPRMPALEVVVLHF